MPRKMGYGDGIRLLHSIVRKEIRGKKMTKTEIISIVAEQAKLSKLQADNAICYTIKTIIENDKTIIKGFGTFEWKTRKARVASNPQTGEKINVPEKRRLCFKPSKSLS
jgi:DNA-binding protein HU-beta